MTRKVAIGRALQLLGWMAVIYWNARDVGSPGGTAKLLLIFLWVVLIEFVMMSTPDGW